jgi:transmembrane sensor
MSAAEPHLRATQDIHQATLRQAAHWLAQLASGEADGDDIAACNAWRDADPEHERAWQLAQRLTGKLRSLPARLALPALDRPRSTSRRTALRGLLGLAITMPLGTYLWQRINVDYRTAAGERLSTLLADGSQLLLDTATELRVEFHSGMRRLQLLSGRIQVRTTRDANPTAPPLLIATRHGNLRTLNSCFTVEAAETDSCVVVESGEVELQSVTEKQVQIIHAGQRSRIGASTIQPPESLQLADLGWIHGLLYAENERLQDVIARLARYRAGWLRCAAEVAELRISGVFRLEDTDQVLAVLARTLHLRVVNLGPWTRLEATSA